MSLELIKYAFVAGEVAETFSFRVDLEKYDLALEIAENWFVDYEGGLSTKPGTEIVDFVYDDTKPVKFFDFKFSPDIANNYLIVASNYQFRFVQDGAYVLESAKSIEGITKASPAVITLTAHGYSNGNLLKFSLMVGMIELEARTLQVANATTDTFELLDFPSSNPIDSTSFGTFTSGSVARVYTVTTPWPAEALDLLRGSQIRDVVRFTRWGYPIYDLVRNDHADWTLSLNARINSVPIPNKPTTEASSPGSFGVGFVVTAVVDKIEGLPSDYGFEYNTDDPALEPASVVVRWNPVAGAEYYNVYRTRYVYNDNVLSKSLEVGYIGRSNGSQFVDDNIVPDFTKTPPIHRDPFANGTIEWIEIINGGSGFDNDDTVSITDPNGTGFVGRVIVDRDKDTGLGPVVGIKIINPGYGYTSPTVNVTGGTGANLVAHVSPLTGNDPAIAAVFQQRQIYAASERYPITIWGSKPKQLSNYAEGDVVLPNDPYEHELDSPSIAPIRHLIPNRNGLLVATEIGWWALTSQSGAITATNIQADQQTYSGASKLPPIGVNGDIAYVEGEGGGVRLLTYNENRRVYGSIDLSVLANHLVKPQYEIKSWDYALNPYKQIHAVRSDGTLLVMTVMQEQEIYAWTRFTTRGLYRDVKVIKEGSTSSIYYLTERKLNGRWSKVIERLKLRNFSRVEDAFCVDCGLALGANYPDAELTLSGTSGTITATASATIFSSDDTGKIFRGGGGMGVATYVSSTEISIALAAKDGDITSVIPQTSPAVPLPLASGTWTLDTPTVDIGGLWHLRNESVSVLADGNVVQGCSVDANGKLTPTLQAPVTRCVVGLGYRCIAKNLPLNIPGETIEGKAKRVVGAALRVHESRGIRVGSRLDETYEMRDRSDEAYAMPTRLQNKIETVMIEPDWTPYGHIYIEQRYPLPGTLLGYVIDAEIGDDPG